MCSIFLPKGVFLWVYRVPKPEDTNPAVHLRVCMYACLCVTLRSILTDVMLRNALEKARARCESKIAIV